MLLRMYLRWAERRGFDGRDEGGLRGRGGGDQVGDLHRQGRERLRPLRRRARRPPAGRGSRRSTPRSAATPPSPRSTSRRWSTTTSTVEIDDEDLRVDTYRASGAGGQHVNKTDSAVRITHMPTGIVVQCQNERSQTQNKATAMRFLRAKLIEEEERKRAEELAAERGEQKAAEWGSQIRSYTLHPDPAGQGPPHRARDRQRRPGARRRHRRLRPRVPEPCARRRSHGSPGRSRHLRLLRRGRGVPERGGRRRGAASTAPLRPLPDLRRRAPPRAREGAARRGPRQPSSRRT